MADHGAKNYDEYGFAQSPLLLIKVKNNKSFIIDETPLAYDRMQDILISIIDGEFDGDVSDFREDSRLFYETDRKVDKRSMVEYVVTKHAFDSDSMLPTGKVIVEYASQRNNLND